MQLIQDFFSGILYSSSICVYLPLGYTSTVTSLLGHENQLFVGTSFGNVEVYDSEKGVFLLKYSIHEKKVRRMLKLPSEIHQCICAELFPRVNSNPEQSISPPPPADVCVTPTKRIVKECALQQKKSVIFDFQLQQHTAPLIASIGDGLANWLNDTKESVTQGPQLLMWTGHGEV